MLLETVSTGVYRPLWNSEILSELDRTLRRLSAKRGAAPEETDAYLTRLFRLFRQMRITFPDAVVIEWEELVPTISRRCGRPEESGQPSQHRRPRPDPGREW